MSESECGTADWRMIGLEDGSKGRLESYVGNHRSACSKFNITPNLDRYRVGHSEGVRLFCTESRGFDHGRKGREYNGVCPTLAERKFLKGYDRGRVIHDLESEVYRLSSLINASNREIDELSEEISIKEDRLVSSGISEEERRRLLREVKDLERRIGELQADLRNYHRHHALAERDLQDALRRY